MNTAPVSAINFIGNAVSKSWQRDVFKIKFCLARNGIQLLNHGGYPAFTRAIQRAYI